MHHIQVFFTAKMLQRIPSIITQNHWSIWKSRERRYSLSRNVYYYSLHAFVFLLNYGFKMSVYLLSAVWTFTRRIDVN